MSLEVVAALLGVWVFGSVPLAMWVGRALGARSIDPSDFLDAQPRVVATPTSHQTRRAAA